MVKFEKIEHRGKEIHRLDLSGASPEKMDEVREAADEMEESVRSEPEDSVLALTVVEDASYDSEMLGRIKELADNDRPYVKRSAVVGVEGLRKVALQGVIRYSGREDFEIFDTEEEAKDWLAGEE
ncbi:MAG: hypothetical protein ABEK01_03115 [Candidatus Nanohaloarchaea archaeon]